MCICNKYVWKSDMLCYCVVVCNMLTVDTFVRPVSPVFIVGATPLSLSNKVLHSWHKFSFNFFLRLSLFFNFRNLGKIEYTTETV